MIRASISHGRRGGIAFSHKRRDGIAFSHKRRDIVLGRFRAGQNEEVEARLGRA